MFSYNISSAKADINGGSTYPNIKGQVYFKETKGYRIYYLLYICNTYTICFTLI